MRDFVAIEDQDKPVTDVENVEVETYNAAAGETPDQVFRKLALKLPDVFCVPELLDTETARLLCNHVNEEQKMAFAGVRAKEAPEALLRALMLKPAAQELAKAATCVLNTRLIRKLCEECKEPFQPAPQLLKKLNIPSDRVATFYRERQPPPPGQRPPSSKKSEEPEICPVCDGLGYHGRTAIFELLAVDDNVRATLVKQPRLEALRQAARLAGARSHQEEGIVLVARGVTSLNELQRVLKQ
jgi:type II secretory ATPase GspE/PulE/Tfp pilus assembly ATPase PilB-like protein